MRRERGRGRGEERSVVQRARREEFMWMWEKHAALLHWLFFITEGKQGPLQSLPHHHKYGWEMCVKRNVQERGKKAEEREIKHEEKTEEI